MNFTYNEPDYSVSENDLDIANINKKKVIRKLTISFIVFFMISFFALYLLSRNIGKFYTFNTKLIVTITFFIITLISYIMIIIHLKGKIKLKHYKKYYSVYDVVQFLLVIIGIIVFMQLFIVKTASIYGGSMEPTLNNKDQVFVFQFNDNYKTDMIVVINAEKYNGNNIEEHHDEDDEFYIKRIKGVSGDVLTLKEIKDTVYYEIQINGVSLKDVNGEVIKVVDQSKHYNTLKELQGTIPEGKYFLLGDNTKNSRDSRSFGYVEKEDIYGYVSFRLWRKIGWIK